MKQQTTHSSITQCGQLLQYLHRLENVQKKIKIGTGAYVYYSVYYIFYQ